MGCLRCCASSGYNISLSIFRGDEQFAWHLACCKRAEPAGLWRCTGSCHDPTNTAGELQQPATSTQSPGEIFLQDAGCWQKSPFEPLWTKCVFVCCSGLLSTFSDGCWYEQGSPTNVHVSPQQHGAAHSVDQHLGEFDRWGNGKMNPYCLFQIRCVCSLFDNRCFFSSVSGSHRNVSGGSQTGDTLGKALASVSMHHLNPY